MPMPEAGAALVIPAPLSAGCAWAWAAVIPALPATEGEAGIILLNFALFLTSLHSDEGGGHVRCWYLEKVE